MKKLLAKVLIFMGIFVFWISVIYATSSVVNNQNKNTILNEKYTWKKLERIKNSIKQKNNYRLLIQTTDSQETVKDYFQSWDKKIKIKKVWTDKYMIKIPLNTDFLREDLSQIDNWALPEKLWIYDIIQPEILEWLWFLDWEETNKLWWINKIWANNFQEELQTKTKVKVAVLDTGIDYTNTDLSNNYDTSLSYDFINDKTDAIDDNWHGTEVSWIIGWLVNWKWVFWVNSNTDLVSLKVLDSNWIGTSYDILEAIDYATQNNIKVLNMSFGWAWFTTNNPICEAITSARNNWTIIITSAWNNNSELTNTIPASCNDTITVWAIDTQDNKASFSNYWSKVSIYAPWVDIYTTWLNNTYQTVNGTSFSTAFVTWLVAKELAYNGSISYVDLISNIKNNYGLVSSFANTTETSTWTLTNWTWLVNTESVFTRFSDFKYLFNTDDYIYFNDMSNSGFVYKIKNDNSVFTSNLPYLKNDFYRIEDYSQDNFNSWEYITYADFIKHYESILYKNDNIDNTKFSVQSIWLWKYNISHKFNHISWIKISNNIWSKLITDNDYVYYINYLDWNKIYKVSKNWNSETKLNDTDTLNLIDTNNYIFYTNRSDWNKIYRMLKDWSWKTKLNDASRCNLVSDLNYMYYGNSSDWNSVYKITPDLTWKTKLNSNNVCYLSLDSNFVYYRNGSDWGKLYKTAKDWTSQTKLNNNSSVYSLIDNNYVYYINAWDWDSIYRVSKDWYWDTKLTDRSRYITMDNNYIYYTNRSEWYKIYKMLKDWSWKIKLEDSPAWAITVDNGYVYYSNYSNQGIYKINLTNPQWFTMDDWFYMSPEISAWKILKFLEINVNSIVPTWTNYDFYLSNGYSNFVKIDNSKLDWNTSLDLNSLFWSTTDKLYYYIQLTWDPSDTTKTPIINSVEFIDGTPPSPTNLKQYVLSPYLEKEEFGSWTEIWTKIWKYQSGSWIILTADIYGNPSWRQLKLTFEVYKYGTNVPIDLQYSSGFILWSTWVILPYYWSGRYYWRVRIENDLWSMSDWVNYGTDNQFETDYGLFEWFEPYPYGYNFENNWPSDWLLDWWISWLDLLNVGTRQIIPWKKWDIFNSAFDLTWYDEIRLMDAFENLGLNKTNAFQWWNCYGMAESAVMQIEHPDFLKSNFNAFSAQIWIWYIWDKINSLSTTSTWNWDIYNDISKTIYSLQLSQYSLNDRLTLFNWYSSWETILSKLINDNKTYILGFLWKDKQGKVIWHAVVPYKVEWNKIYVWDNNIQFPVWNYYNKITNKYEQFNAYSLYIEINNDWTWNVPLYKNDFESFDKIALIDTDKLYNFWKKSWPSWFLWVDILYTVNWTSDLQITDSQWRISWFSWWTILEEIPWVHVIIPLIGDLSWTTENIWKQIYLPQKQNLTVKVIAKSQENYDLMVAWWDYYTKLEKVSTSTGQIDTFTSTWNELTIDFDDTKTWSYNLLTDNFQENNTWTIYIDQSPIITSLQEYNIDWQKVQDNSNDAVTQSIDTNNDWIFYWTWDVEITLPPVFQDLLAPTTTVSFSWIQTPNQTGSYIETTTITLQAEDNEWWSWVDKIYYSLDNTWSTDKTYLEYTSPIIVNWVNNYTLTYYSVDKFWNKETPKIENFALTEKPETYQWEINWYVYEDTNSNWIKDTWENVMAWWKMCIDKNNNWTCEENIEPFILSNNNWYYEFNWLATWIYKVLEIPHQNWIVMNPSIKYYTIQLSNWQKVANKNFGNLKTKVK